MCELHKRHKMKPNPLYRLGQSRVGCYPCIYSHPRELVALAEHHPEHVDRLRRWERKVGDVTNREMPQATFLPNRGVKYESIFTETHGIDKQIADARAKIGELLPNDEVRSQLGANDMSDCDEWGVCE